MQVTLKGYRVKEDEAPRSKSIFTTSLQSIHHKREPENSIKATQRSSLIPSSYTSKHLGALNGTLGKSLSIFF